MGKTPKAPNSSTLLIKNFAEIASISKVIGIDHSEFNAINSSISSMGKKQKDIDDVFLSIRSGFYSIKSDDNFKKDIVRNGYSDWIQNEIQEVIYDSDKLKIQSNEREIMNMTNLIMASLHAENSLVNNPNSLFYSDLVGLMKGGKNTPTDLFNSFQINKSTYLAAFKNVDMDDDDDDAVEAVEIASGLDKGSLTNSKSSEVDNKSIFKGFLDAFEKSPVNKIKARRKKFKPFVEAIREVGDKTINSIKNSKKGVAAQRSETLLGSDLSDLETEMLSSSSINSAIICSVGASTVDTMSQRSEYDDLEFDEVAARAKAVVDSADEDKIADSYNNDDNAGFDAEEAAI